MEAAWLLIIAAVAAMGAASWMVCKTQAAQRIAERIGFGDQPEWANKSSPGKAPPRLQEVCTRKHRKEFTPWDTMGSATQPIG